MIMDTTRQHTIEITNRKMIIITGIKTIDSFDSKEFLIDTDLGYLHITGNNLTLDRLDTNGGEIVIKGDVNSLSYVSASGKATKEGFLKRLLK
ncbi:TPA: sporulation protein YabP [bacterium]|jgi:sporulation protein YabP|nr:sporulation protein YabP [bacterium]